jgi:glycosyltransferase involved in cell wall biosynthesis
MTALSVAAPILLGPPAPSVLPLHVALATNFVAPYRLPVYAELARRVERLTILVSTRMESNRTWPTQWGDLDVRVQRSLTLRRRWRHEAGFQEQLELHIPWDTPGQLRRLRPDCVVSGEMGARSLGAAAYCAAAGRPLVLWATLSEHTERGRGWPRHVLRRWLARRTAAVLVNGAGGARYVQGLGISKSRIVEAPYVALPDHFTRCALDRPPPDPFRLLAVGQLVERKGLAPLLRELASWAGRNPQRRIEFALVGAGPESQRIAGQVLPHNVALRMLGERTYDELPDLYAQAHALAFPTLADEWGLVVNEALAAGVPVLGSRYSQAVEELIDDGETGWVFTPDEPGDLAHALERALGASADELCRMRAAARRRVATLTPAWSADQVIRAIRIAVGSSREAGR